MNTIEHTQRCQQCGREGTRGFQTIPAVADGTTYVVGPYTVCANWRACEKRWPRPDHEGGS